MDDGMGKRSQTQGEIGISSRARKGEELQLGWMEKTFLEAS